MCYLVENLNGVVDKSPKTQFSVKDFFLMTFINLNFRDRAVLEKTHCHNIIRYFYVVNDWFKNCAN